MKRKINPISVSDILRTISDSKSLRLVSILAANDRESEDLITTVGISRKEYYSRIVRLVDAGLIKKVGRVYNLSYFGRIIYEAQLMLAQAINEHSTVARSYSMLKSIEIPADFDGPVDIKGVGANLPTVNQIEITNPINL